jgi:hypothetical protein
VLDEQFRHEWCALDRAAPIHPGMTFALEGLVLGGGTVLLRADGQRRLQSLRGQEARVLALLSAAYGRAIAPAVLGNIERAVKSWRDGEECLAYIHLAHSRLHAPSDVRAAAYRLFTAENAMKVGLSLCAVFQALKIDRSYIDAVEKAYNPAEPRVPAGSGRTSGKWTDSEEMGADDAAREGTAGEGPQGSSLLGRMPLPATSFLAELDAAQVAELSAYASRLLGLGPVGAAVAAFGLLFIPSPNNIRVEGEVPEIPGLRYSWNRDETQLHLTYDDPNGGQRTFALHLDGDIIRDDDRQVVGRIVGGNRIAIDTLAVVPDLVKQDEPRLCPVPASDVAGSDQGKPYEENRSRQYEDFVKLLINPPPDGPTPSGFVYYLPNSLGGDLVSYDDCKWTNGILFEIKGEGLAKLTNDLPDVMGDKFIYQATRQLAASGGRPVVWIFAEQEAALFARELFDDEGLWRITVGYIPWIRSGR